MAASFGDLGSSMGLTNSQNIEMSTTLVQLAADMASFKNISVDRANTALQAVYTGETESLKAMGIVMTEANLQAFAMAEGIKKQYTNMTQQEKVMLRYRYVLQATSNAQGDFARTGGGMANQSRMMMENLKQLGAQFGQTLAPSVNNVIQLINNFLQGLQSLTPEQTQLIATIGLTVAAFGTLLSAAGSAITTINAMSTAMAALNISTGGVIAIIGAAALAIGALAASFLTGGEVADNSIVKFDELGNVINDTAGDADALGESIENLPQGKDIDISADTAQAETNVDSLLGKTKEIVSKDVIFNIETTNANTNVQTLAQSLADLLDGSGKFKTEAKDLKDILEEQTTALTNYYNSLAASQILFLTGLRQQGSLSAEEYNKMVGEVIAVQQNQISTTEAQKKANEALIKTINGDGEITMKESESIYKMLTEGYDLTAVASLTAMETYTKFAEVVKNGYGDTELAAAYASQFATALNAELKTAAEAAATATDKYKSAVEAADAKLQADTAVKEANLIANTNNADALNLYVDAVSNGIPQVDALRLMEEAYGTDTVKAIQDACEEKGGIFNMSLAELYRMAADYWNSADALQKEKNNGWAKDEKAHQDALIAAEQAYLADITGINTTFSAEDLARWKALYESQGYVIDEETNNSLDIMMKFLKDVEDGVITDGETIQSQWETIWNSLPQYIKDSMTDSKDDASSGGKDVGAKLGEGVESGIETAKSGIIKRARNAVAAAIAAMKQEAQTASPSKKTRDLIGKPLAQGVAVGFGMETENTIKAVKAGMQGIISGGVTVTQQAILKGNSTTTAAKAVHVEQHNTFTSRTLTPYEIQIQQKQLSKNLLKGVS